MANCVRIIGLGHDIKPSLQPARSGTTFHVDFNSGQFSMPQVRCWQNNLVHVAAALAVVLGSRNVEISATRSSIIHGLKASRLAKVRFGTCIAGVSLD